MLVLSQKQDTSKNVTATKGMKRRDNNPLKDEMKETWHAQGRHSEDTGLIILLQDSRHSWRCQNTDTEFRTEWHRAGRILHCACKKITFVLFNKACVYFLFTYGTQCTTTADLSCCRFHAQCPHCTHRECTSVCPWACWSRSDGWSGTSLWQWGLIVEK